MRALSDTDVQTRDVSVASLETPSCTLQTPQRDQYIEKCQRRVAGCRLLSVVLADMVADMSWDAFMNIPLIQAETEASESVN